MIDWITALLRSGVSQEKLEAHIPFVGALLKALSEELARHVAEIQMDVVLEDPVEVAGQDSW